MHNNLFKLQRYTPIPFILLAWLFTEVNTGLQTFGGLLIALGIFLRFIAAAYLNNVTEQTRELVTDGPYAFIRNPRYFGNILIYVGMVIAAGGLLPHLLWIAIFFFSIQYILIARFEERQLSDNFLEKYRLYTQMVPRFYPRLSPYPARRKVKGDFKTALQEEKYTLIISVIILVLFELRWNVFTF